MLSKVYETPTGVIPRTFVRLYAGLNTYLAPESRFVPIALTSGKNAAVSELLESAGVPLSEVHLVMKNGESVGFDSIVTPGDRLSIYPAFERLNVRGLQRLRP